MLIQGRTMIVTSADIKMAEQTLPELGDLKADSSAIAGGCNVVLYLSDDGDLCLLKNRYGATGDVLAMAEMVMGLKPGDKGSKEL